MRTRLIILIFLFALCPGSSFGQAKHSGNGRIVDTTLIMAKEFCRNGVTTCSNGDFLYLNRMLVFDGDKFWKNYSDLFHFTGLVLRNYQQQNGIDFEYVDKVEDFLESDTNNDENVISLINKRRINGKKISTDTVLFKLYTVKMKYVLIGDDEEFVPNLGNSKSKASYIWRKSKIYYIINIESILPYNEVPIDQRRLIVMTRK